MSRIKKLLAQEPDVSDLLSIGLFGRMVPKELIEKVLIMTGRYSQRVRLFPADAVVYFVMAMSLFRDPPIEEIMRIYTETARLLTEDSKSFQIPNKSAISQGRSRLGSEPMRLIADEVLKPIAPQNFRGAWYKGMRLMSLDGTCFDTPDEPENASYFGYPSASRGEPAFPQVRVLALVETGTHAVTAAEIGPYRTSEHALTKALFERGKLTSDMLLLADRNFFCYRLWATGAATGAKMVFRAKVGLNLPLLEELPDGSFVSVIRDSQNRKAEPIRVRVIEYKLQNLKGAPDAAEPGEDKYRLVTNIFDHGLAPAKELAALYHERWEIETLYGEFKKVLHSANTTLRSKTPDLVLQELWGLILVHFVLRDIMAESAWQAKLDPDRLSFKGAVHVVRRKLPLVAAFPPRD